MQVCARPIVALTIGLPCPSRGSMFIIGSVKNIEAEIDPDSGWAGPAATSVACGITRAAWKVNDNASIARTAARALFEVNIFHSHVESDDYFRYQRT